MPPRPELCETEPTDHQRDPADNSDPDSGIPTGANGGNRRSDPHRVSGAHDRCPSAELGDARTGDCGDAHGEHAESETDESDKAGMSSTERC